MKPLLLTTLALLSAAAFAAPRPANGTLGDATGPLEFAGGPFLAPNPASDRLYLGDSEPTPLLVCQKEAMNCDRFVLKIALSDSFRDKAAKRKQVLRLDLQAQERQPLPLVKPELHLYVFDAKGAELGHSDFGGTDTLEDHIVLPLKKIPNGDYSVVVTGYNGLGASYAAQIRFGSAD